MMSRRWYLGTTGFSFPDWGRSFYPGRLGAAARLGWYARQFNAVEIDSTVHALPSPERVAGWASAVPPGFRFCVIAPHSLTHGSMRLDGAVARRSLERLVRTLAPLERKLAVILLQFPPRFRFSRLAEMEGLLENLPAGHWRYALELQHADWWQPATVELLREHGVAWVTADRADRRTAALPQNRVPADGYQPLIAPVTADFLYLRWPGQPDQFPDLGREHLDAEPRLAWWKRRLDGILEQQPVPGGLFGFFGNGFAGHAPASCRRFRSLVEGHITAQEAPMRQPGLFDP